MSQYEPLFPDFYSSSAKDVWLCKICTPFSQDHSGSRAFIDKPGRAFIDKPSLYRKIYWSP